MTQNVPDMHAPVGQRFAYATTYGVGSTKILEESFSMTSVIK